MPSNITHNRAGFAAQIRKFVEKSELNMDQTLRKTLIAVGDRLLEKTPVDTGRLSGNWQFGVDEIPGTIVEVTGASGDGQAVKEAAAEQLRSTINSYDLKLGSVFYLINNLPYAPVVEYGLYPNPPKGGAGKTSGGYSTQAPEGMVRVTAVEFQDFVRDAVARMGD